MHGIPNKPINLEQKIEAGATLLQRIASEYSPAALASSLGAEDMVLIDLACKHAPSIEVITLDTGRLPEETYQLMHATRQHYRLNLQVYFPDAPTVENYVRIHGPNAFYDSIDMRKACCHMRKVEPLRRALAGKKAWITGMRRSQSEVRRELPIEQWDNENGLRKFNPLMDWSHQDVWTYIRSFNVPYNRLHDKGYTSIGCAPCTRAISVGEDIRAGRWWWENEDTTAKECGLHKKKTTIGET